eukprot:jgi/Astpho2/1646/fgenesh1_pg.00032_%23_3_t
MPIRSKPNAKKPSAKRVERLDSSVDDDDSQDVRTKLLLDEYMAKEADDMMAQPATQPAGVPTGTPMMPCSVSGIMAGASSGALGLVYGAGSTLVTHRGPGRLAACRAAGWSSAVSFGVMGAMYAGVGCFVKRLRQKEDAWNAGAAGFATGVTFAWGGSRAAILQSALGLGAMSYVLEKMGVLPESSTSSLPDELEAEVDTGLKERLDVCNKFAAQQLQDYLRTLKARLSSQSESQAALARQQSDRAMQAKQTEIEGLRETLAQDQATLQRYTVALAKLLGCYVAARDSKQVADIFIAWSHYAQGCRRKAKMLLVAGQHYTVGRLQRAVVLAWQKAAAHERRATVAQRLQQAHQAGKAAAWTDCEVVVARVEGDLAAAHQAIQQERAARERLEQEMKRAFMRGVCALNIEAMTVMKRGMPGGVNPFPVAVKLDGDSLEGPGAAAESVQQQEAQHAQEFGDSGLDTRRGVPMQRAEI